MRLLAILVSVAYLTIPIGLAVAHWRARRRAFAQNAVLSNAVLSRLIALRCASRGLRIIGLLVIVCLMSAPTAVGILFGYHGTALLLFLFGIALYFTWYLWPILSDRGMQDLASRGFMVCPRCDYDLRGHGNDAVCPDCGLPYDADMLRDVWTLAVRNGLRRGLGPWR